ncbi:MAG: NADH-quinone oxidoreductase subunit NuoK [Alphaproteobacteria bacterium]|nr:NADH-quinone oxidoreductase subunit NuoK [Alphaproteobacteria bacterium]
MFTDVYYFLTVSGVLFSLGMLGIILNRQNIIRVLMSIELILLAGNINFVVFSVNLSDLSGQIFSLFVLTMSAAEVAVGLAIVVLYFRDRHTIAVDDASTLKG